MTLQLHIAETGKLVCDDVERGEVELSITVHRNDETGRTSAAGTMKSGGGLPQECRGCTTAALITRHFGRVMIQIHHVDDVHARFDIVEPFAVIGVDAPEAPSIDYLDEGSIQRSSAEPDSV